MLTEKQAFEAMRCFLQAFWERGGSDPESDLVDVLSWTGSDVWADGGTQDPAQWEDWLSAVRSVRTGRNA
jgi:hypothetical protein